MNFEKENKRGKFREQQVSVAMAAAGCVASSSPSCTHGTGHSTVCQ